MASLWDAFSSQPAQDAAGAQTAGIMAGLPQIQGYYGAAGGTLGAGGAAATGALNTNFGNANAALSANAGNAADALKTNFGNAGNAATVNYMAGMQPFMQNFNTGTQGVGAYSDAMGLNGPAGGQRSTQAFWNNPAIQSALQVGGENATRQANASGGGPASGGTLAALDKYGQQVASQGWQNYVSNLSPYFDLSKSGASGVGGMYQGLGNTLAGVNTGLGTSLADTYNRLGTSLAGVDTGLGTGTAGIATGTAAGQAGLQRDTGNAMYGGLTSIGNANANADLANYNASGNMWGALLGGVGAGSKLFGMFGGGKAKGGPVKKGKLHVVGEEGPEIFMPKRDGVIIPNPRTVARIRRQPPGQQAREDRYPTGNARMAA